MFFISGCSNGFEKGVEELRKKIHVNRSAPSWHAEDSIQRDVMRASTSRCSPIKLEAAKFLAETLGGHSTTISNLN